MRRREVFAYPGGAPAFEPLEPRLLLAGNPYISELMAINDVTMQVESTVNNARRVIDGGKWCVEHGANLFGSIASKLG